MMNTQNDPPPQRRKFGWFGLRRYFRTLRQMYRFHNTWNAHEAQRQWRREGKAEGLKECPIVVYGREVAYGIYSCGHDAPLIAICPGIFTCPACRKVETATLPVARPTIRLTMPQELERTTGPIDMSERPAVANMRRWHPDEEAGSITKEHRAMRKTK
jgi:hypothetical protein